MKLWGFIFLISCFSVEVFATNCGELGAVPGEYLVRWQSSSAISTLSAKTTHKYKIKKWIHAVQTESLMSKAFEPFAASVPALSLHENLRDSDVEELKDDSNVLSIEPNCYRQLQMKPNDSNFSYQWGLQSIEAEAAWNRSIGRERIVVAVSDTGVDYTHEDLRDQMWINIREQNGQAGVDDDGNGCIDDIYGCDLANHDGDPMPSSADSMSFHGTHVAGIIGAKPNNGRGISGVAWNVKIMAAKGFADQTMNGTLANLIDSIYYAANNGARVINCSWGGAGSPSQAERDVIRYARNKGILVVVAAGNNGVNAGSFTPASISEAFTVGSHNLKNMYSSFSNYGTALDILAPGGDIVDGGRVEGIYSTALNNSYIAEVGTSMAAPFVSGVAALVLSVNSNLSLSQLEDILIQSATPTILSHPNNPGLNYSHRLLNAKQAVEMALATLPQENSSNACDPQQNQNCSLDLSSTLARGDGKAEMAGCGQVSGKPTKLNASSSAFFFLLFLLPLFIYGQFFFQRNY